MKNKSKLFVCAIGIGIAGALYLAAGSWLRGEMERSLSAACGRPVKVRSIYPVPPLAVRLAGVEIPPIEGEERSPLGVDSLKVWPGRGPGQRAFALEGRLADGRGGELGKVSVRGGYIRNGPLDAEVTVDYADIVKLSSYLEKILGTAPIRGSMRMETRLTLHQGVLMTRNEVEAAGVAFSGNVPTTLGPDGNRLVELLRDPQGKVHLTFIVAGKPGEKMDWSDLAAGAMREAMRQAMSHSIQRVLSETEQQKPVEELMRKKLDTLDR